MAGERIAALAISEPACGSDVAAIQTRARVVGDDFVISGQKLWITNGAIADFLVLAVRTAEHPHKGLSLVLFPTDAKGFSVGRKLSKVAMSHPTRPTCSSTSAGFRAAVSWVPPAAASTTSSGHFQGERLATSLLVLSFMERALELALEYARERSAFGQKLIQNQVWRHRFAETRATIEASRWLVYRAVDLMNRRQPATREVTMAKLFTTEQAQRVTYDCMQVFGGFGYTTEYPIGRIWRDMRFYTIGAGTSEIMKEILARTEKM